MALIQHTKKLSKDMRKKSAQGFLRVLGKTNHIEFRYTENPKTNGQVVWLGELDPEDEFFETYAMGHGIHEMLHVTKTDIDVYNDKSLTSFGQELLNILEDIRLERLGVKEFSGYKLYREELIGVLEEKEKLAYSHDSLQTQASSLLLHWLYIMLLHDVGFTWTEKFIVKDELLLLHFVPKFELKKIYALGQAIHKTRSTKGALAVTKKILTYLKERADKATELQKDGLKGKTPSVKENNLSFFASVLKDIPRPSSPRKRERATPAPNAAPSKAKRTDGFTVNAWSGRLSSSAEIKRDAAEYCQYYEKELKSAGKLKKQFEKALQTPSATRERGALKGDFLYSNFIEEAIQKTGKILSKNIKTPIPKASVVLLLDRSGSMGVEKMTKAKIAVSLLVTAFKKVPTISYSLALFPGYAKCNASLLGTEKNSLQDIHQRLKQIGAYGSTPIREALRYAVSVLKTRDKENRLIVLMTDGNFPVDEIEKLKTELKKNAIELALLDIDTKNPLLTEPRVYVEETKDIAPALLSLIKKTKCAKKLTAAE